MKRKRWCGRRQNTIKTNRTSAFVYEVFHGSMVCDRYYKREKVPEVLIPPTRRDSTQLDDERRATEKKLFTLTGIIEVFGTD